MRTKQAATPADDGLTAEEQAALDAQRAAVPEIQPAPETPQSDAVEAPAEGGEPEPPGDKRPQMVPHAALHEERERRKEAERRAAEIERRAEERFATLLEKFGQPAQPTQPATPAVPDAQQDPVGHIVGTMQQLGHSQEQINQEIAAFRQQQQQQQLIAAVQQQTAALETEYRSEVPDYESAIAHLRQVRDRQLQAAGWTDPARRQAQISQEALAIAAQALQQGVNPAERFYRMSEASGYTKPQAPATPAATAADPAAQIQRIAQGQRAAGALNGARGTGPGPMTQQKLLEMNDDEFLKLVQSSTDARALLGL